MLNQLSACLANHSGLIEFQKDYLVIRLSDDENFQMMFLKWGISSIDSLGSLASAVGRVIPVRVDLLKYL